MDLTMNRSIIGYNMGKYDFFWLKVIKAKDTCYVILDFYTDLACDHQATDL